VCFLTRKVTGKQPPVQRRTDGRKSSNVYRLLWHLQASRHSTSDIRIPRNAFQEAKIKVVKHSPVSTGQLRLLPALHIRPINLVVYQGASGPKSNET
jgi:hypothetical protein